MPYDRAAKGRSTQEAIALQVDRAGVVPGVGADQRARAADFHSKAQRDRGRHSNRRSASDHEEAPRRERRAPYQA